MADTKEGIFTGPMKKGVNTKKEILLGICLFVGMNYAFALGGFVLVNFLAGLDHTDSTFFRDLSVKVVLGSAFLVNASIFVYLIIKRPLMSIGILAVIPALVLLWCAVILMLLLLLVALYILMFLVWASMILFVFVFPWVLLGCGIIFIVWLIIAAISIALLVLRNVREKARQKGG